MTERWNEVFANEELAKKIIVLQPEEAQKVLAENGYEFDLDEIIETGKEINEILTRYNNGEISEEDLANVAGGANHVGCFVLGVVIGVALGW